MKPIIAQKLDDLASVRQRLAELEAPFRERMAGIEAEMKAALEDVQAEATQLEAEIRADVLSIGESVKGEALMAVWSKPRVSWDTKALDGYAVAHPEILPLRKEGEPSVAIRPVAAKKEAVAP